LSVISGDNQPRLNRAQLRRVTLPLHLAAYIAWISRVGSRLSNRALQSMSATTAGYVVPALVARSQSIGETAGRTAAARHQLRNSVRGPRTGAGFSVQAPQRVILKSRRAGSEKILQQSA
jgi:hypothetical protein